jgi:hypothetical protein
MTGFILETYLKAHTTYPDADYGSEVSEGSSESLSLAGDLVHEWHVGNGTKNVLSGLDPLERHLGCAFGTCRMTGNQGSNTSSPRYK